MFLQVNKDILLSNKYKVFFDGLSVIYSDMDQKYKAAEEYYGFYCAGCRDNCCLTRFYHHTFIECYYMFKGYQTLEDEKKDEINKRSQAAYEKTKTADKKGILARVMCPLNFDGLCSLYKYRPMICRLHGIPHELQRPGRGVLYGPGCESFSRQCKDKSYFKFDRTPFYIKIAGFENKFKQAAGHGHKFKMTITEMVVNLIAGNMQDVL